MLQGSGAMPTLVVEEGPSEYSSDQTDPEESPSLAPTTLPRSRSVHTNQPDILIWHFQQFGVCRLIFFQFHYSSRDWGGTDERKGRDQFLYINSNMNKLRSHSSRIRRERNIFVGVGWERSGNPLPCHTLVYRGTNKQTSVEWHCFYPE